MHSCPHSTATDHASGGPAALTLAAHHDHIPAAQLVRRREALALVEAESVVAAVHVELHRRAMLLLRSRKKASVQ